MKSAKKPIDYICALRYEYEFTADGIVQGIDTAG